MVDRTTSTFIISNIPLRVKFVFQKKLKLNILSNTIYREETMELKEMCFSIIISVSLFFLIKFFELSISKSLYVIIFILTVLIHNSFIICYNQKILKLLLWY
jgi:hypothetical protein